MTPAAFPHHLEMTTLCPWPRPFQSKINQVRQTLRRYHSAKFQVIPISGFRFIVVTYTPTRIPTYTHIVTKWSPYPRRRTTSTARVISSFIKRKFANASNSRSADSVKEQQTIWVLSFNKKTPNKILGVWSASGTDCLTWHRHSWKPHTIPV